MTRAFDLKRLVLEVLGLELPERCAAPPRHDQGIKGPGPSKEGVKNGPRKLVGERRVVPRGKGASK
jgi:hypothetical protein